MKIVIVGGVAGGATAAARIRRLDEQAEILVFERSGYISYANCGLPYYIGGVIEDPEELTLQTPESFFSRFRITMKVHHEVIAVHPERKCVSVRREEQLVIAFLKDFSAFQIPDRNTFSFRMDCDHLYYPGL